MMHSAPARVVSLMEKIDESNTERKYKRRESASALLKRSEPMLITVYRQDDTSVKYGFSLRGGARENIVDPSSSRGQYIRSVDLDSPADKAGLRAGDRILAVGDTPCEGECHEVVRDLVKHAKSPLQLLILRDDALATRARSTTAAMLAQNLKTIINEETGMPTVTAEMKGQRLGRTKKVTQEFLGRSRSTSEGKPAPASSQITPRRTQSK